MPVTTLYDSDGRPVQVDLPDEDEERDNQGQRSNAEWAALRRERKQREDAEKALADYKRLDTFRTAGLRPDDPRHSYFVKGYDGKDDVDSIQKAAAEAGLLVWVDDDKPPQGQGQQGATQATGAPAAQTPAGAPQMSAEALQAAALAAQQAISGSAMGGSPIPTTGVSALDDAYAKGGVPAMIQAARAMGVPIVDTQDGVN